MSLLKAKAECAGDRTRCTAEGCPLFGTPRRDGRITGCLDPSGRGRVNRAKGDKAGKRARQILDLTGANSRHEEVWGGTCRVEVKTGAQAEPIWTRYKQARAQSLAAKSIGDVRPFVMLAGSDHSKHQLLIIRDDDLEAFVVAQLEAWGWIK